MSTQCNTKRTRKSTSRRARERAHAGLTHSIEEAVEKGKARVTYLDFPDLGSHQVRASFDDRDIS
jgi:hypothetical protein